MNRAWKRCCVGVCALAVAAAVWPGLSIVYAIGGIPGGVGEGACSSDVILTGNDFDGDGIEDRWEVVRPDGQRVAPRIVDAPNAGWRGSDPTAEGPFLGTAAYPVLGDGRWIEGGHPDGLGGDGSARGDDAGEYTFTRRFDLAGRESFALRFEWSAADAVVAIRINGVALEGSGCAAGAGACVADYIDNASGATVAGSGLADNRRQIHRVEVTDPARFNFDVDASGSAWNTVEIVVRNEGGPVGLLVTAGEGTSVRGGELCADGSFGVELPVYYDGVTNWAGKRVTTWADPQGGSADTLQVFAVVELNAVNRGLLSQLLDNAGAELVEFDPTTAEERSVDAEGITERFLYLYQVQAEVPCLSITALRQEGAFARVGLLGPPQSTAAMVSVRDAGDLDAVDARTRGLEFVSFADPYGEGPSVPWSEVLLRASPPSFSVSFDAPPIMVPCFPFGGGLGGDVPYGGGPRGGLGGELPFGPYAEGGPLGPVVWGTSDRSPALLRHEMDWERPQMGEVILIGEPAGEGVIGADQTSGTVVNLQAAPRSNSPPVFEAAGPFKVREGELLGFQIVAQDPDGDPIELAVDPNTLPRGAGFDAQFGGFLWRPDFDQAGVYELTFEACEVGFVDRATQCSSLTVEIEVLDANRPPEIVEAVRAGISSTRAPLLSGQRYRVMEGERLEAELFAIDPDGDPVQFGALNLPVGARFDADTRVLSWTTRPGDAGTYEVTAMAFDGRLAAYAPVTIEVLPNRDTKGGSSSGGCAYGATRRAPNAVVFLLGLVLLLWRGLYTRARQGRLEAGVCASER